MKRTKIFISIALTVAAAGLLFTIPVFADTTAKPEENAPAVAPTFSEEVSQSGELAKLRFGHNQLFAGNNITVDSKTDGLLFAFGNQMDFSATSEYTFVAGNIINYEAATEKDLFAAGNIIDLKSDAKIGRDVYAAGNRVILGSDLTGDFSAAASQVILRDVKITGNVNIDAQRINFEGKISIAGTLTYNDDAEVSGLENVKAAKVETYTPETYTVSAAELWLMKLVSIISLALAAIILLAFSARLRNRVSGESAISDFGSNLVIGLVSLLAVPAISIVLLISFFAAPLGLILIFAYIIALYLAQALAGAWLGHLLISKVFHSQAHIFIEAIVGIIILVCLSMVPGLNVVTSFLATLLGLGILMRSIKSKNDAVSNEPVVASGHAKTSTNRAKTAKVAKTVKTTKATKTAKKTSIKKKA